MKLKHFLLLLALAISYMAKPIEPVVDFIAHYTGNCTWIASTKTLEIGSSGELRFANKGTKDFIWAVPDTVSKIFIKSNVTVDAAFHINGDIMIQGEDRNTSVIFGTDTQAWPLVNGLEGSEQNYAQIMADESKWKYFVTRIDNLTILNARSYAVRCWDRPAHMSNCNVIDNRGGWKNHSDGFEGGHFSTITNCYFETGDDVIKIYKDLTVKNCTIKMILNSVPFQFGWGTYGLCRAEIENVTIIGNSGRGEWEGSAPIFQWQGGSDKRTVIMKDCHFDVPHASLFDLNPSGGGLDLTISNSYINVQKYAYQLNAWGKRTICGENEPTDKKFWDDTEAPYIDITSEFSNAVITEGGDYMLAANVSDNETSVDSVFIFLNDSLVSKQTNGTVNYTFEKLPAGIFTIRIEASDTEGNDTYRYFNVISKCGEDCQGVNLLLNPSMEEGKAPWVENVSGLWHSKAEAYEGEASLEVNRMYNSYNNQGIKQVITPQLKAYGEGKYLVSAYVKQADGDPINAYASVFIKRNKGVTPAGESDYNFKTPTIQLSTSEWRQISAIIDISWDKMYYAWFTLVSPTDEAINPSNFYIDNCELTPVDAGNYPSVTITSPKEGAIFTLGDPVALSATADYSKGEIDSVVVTLNGKKVKTLVSSPYNHIFDGLSAGAYNISVKAFADDEKTMTATTGFTVQSVATAYKTLQAENYGGSSGGLTKDAFCQDHIGQIDGGEWIMFPNLDFEGGDALCSVSATAGYDRPNSSIEVHLDSLTSPVAAQIAIPNTGGWCNYQVFSEPFKVSGMHHVYLLFKGADDIFDVDWVKFSRYTLSNTNLVDQSLMHVYPNPVTDKLFIRLPGQSNINVVRILDISGRIILERSYASNHIEIDLSEFAANGIFIVHVNTSSGDFYKRIIVQ